MNALPPRATLLAPSPSAGAASPGAGVSRADRPTLAKIVATIGPASQDGATIRRLIRAGVNVFRFNFSHGTAAEHAARLATVREASAELGISVAVLGDLPGPKTRVGAVPPPGISVVEGEEVLVDSTHEGPARPAGAGPGGTGPAGAGPAGAGGGGRLPSVFGCTIAGLREQVRAGERVLINDGAVRMRAVEPAAGDGPAALRCRVEVGGLITSGKGLNLPDTELTVPAMTERDWGWAQWAVDHELDLVALSFVRRAEEVERLRDALAEKARARGESAGHRTWIPVVAKIEKPQAVANIDEIVRVADALMVARGDLGVECELATVPVIQRRLIAAADAAGKPCIVATQMLETMIESAAPTRAEVSDVANAIFDGADAVMLSGEVAVGRHPVLVVETMRRIVQEAEHDLALREQRPSPPADARQARHPSAALAHAAWHLVHDSGATAVAVWSELGGTARYLSQVGLRVPILAYTSRALQARRMALLKAVRAVCVETPADVAAWTKRVDRDLVERGVARPGERVVLMAGMPLGEAGTTTGLALHTVGESGGR